MMTKLGRGIFKHTNRRTLAAERQHPISVTQLRACAQCSPHHLIRRMLTRHVIVAAGSVPEYAFYVFFLQNSKKNSFLRLLEMTVKKRRKRYQLFQKKVYQIASLHCAL